MKELDFLPASFHEARRRRQVRGRNLLYLAGLALALGCLHFVHASKVKTAEAALSVLQNSDRERNLRRSQLQALQVKEEALSYRLDLLNRLKNDAPVDVVIAEITRQMGNSMALRSVIQEVLAPPKAAKGEKEADPVLERGPTRVWLQGVAATDMEVGIFFGRLAGCPLFDQVELIFSRETETGVGPMREFELAFTVKPIEIEP